MHGIRAGMKVWCTLIVLVHRQNLTLKMCYMKMGRGANIICNSTQAMLTTALWGALIGVKSNTGCDNISAFFGKWEKGSGKQSSFFNQWRVGPSYGEYLRKERSVSNENFKFTVRKHPCVKWTERTGMVPRYEIHPQLKAGRSSWRICRHASHLFDLQEQLSSLNVKKNHLSAPLFSTLP